MGFSDRREYVERRTDSEEMLAGEEMIGGDIFMLTVWTCYERGEVRGD